MKIQDYIHYYIGCNVLIDQGTVNEERGRLLGVCPVPNSVNQIYYHIVTDEMAQNEGPDFCMPYNDDADSVARIKPYLRPMSSITEYEAEHLAMIYTGADSVKRIEGTVSNWFYFECYFNGAEKEILKMPKDGGPYYAHMFDDDAPGFRNIIHEQHAFHYLLQNHFDLFGLIDAGLAIEITIQPTT